jgi:molybdopterin biosynthesis enzyme
MSLALRHMKSIPVEASVGAVLCHDITQIIPGKVKGPVFRKGHIVSAGDIPVLLSVGKEHLYVYEPGPGILHEDEAALRIAAAVAGKNLRLSAPSEGRINFHAECRGLLRVDVETLTAVNCLEEISLAVLHSMQEVKQGQAVGGTRVIPLLIEEEKIARLEALATSPLVEVLPLRRARVGIVTTGSEIYHGRIQDAFGPVLERKVQDWDGSILGQRFTGDDVEMTAAAVRDFAREGADLIMVTGGMSVDPDDRTPAAIRQAGADIISYGAPTFPGAMFLLARLGEIPVLGLPGCVMYHKASIFDLIVPRLLAGIAVTRRDIAVLGHGGFCAACPECRYPLCPFGKG